MRITRQKLIDLAQTEVERQLQDGAAVLSGYLIGSVASGDPLFAGTADIDLVLIHRQPTPRARERRELSEHVHLDIAHHALERYQHPPALRVHPWMGPALAEPVFLYDPDHQFERIQAGARGQYHRPDHVLARAQAFLARARICAQEFAPPRPDLARYLEGVLAGANAAASLAGPPAAGRRVALQLRQRTEQLGHPELAAGFLALLGAESGTAWDLPSWLTAWARAWDAAEPNGRSRPQARRAYYLSAFQAFAEDGQPAAALWPMLDTWNRLIEALPAQAAPEHRPAWQDARARLRLSAAHAAERRRELDAYLDQVEAVLEGWGGEHGA